MLWSHTGQIQSGQLQPQSSQKLYNQNWRLFVPLNDQGFVGAEGGVLCTQKK